MLNTGVLDMEIQGSQETVDKVLCFASEMILAIVNHQICSSVSVNNEGGENPVHIKTTNKFKVAWCLARENG